MNMVKTYFSLSGVIWLKIDYIHPILLIYFLYCTLYHPTISIRILATATVATTAVATSSKNNNQHQCQQRQKGLAKADTTRLNNVTIPIESHILTHRRPQWDGCYHRDYSPGSGPFPNVIGEIMKLLKVKSTPLLWANYCAMSVIEQAIWEERDDALLRQYSFIEL